MARPNARVVLSSCDGSIINTFALGTVHPHPYLYRYQTRQTLVNYATKLAADSTILQPITNKLHPQCEQLLARAKAVLAHDRTTGIHPIQLAAAILFSNGDIEVSWQLKGLEYGCTLDPVLQLLHAIENRRYCEPCVSSAPSSAPTTTTTTMSTYDTAVILPPRHAALDTSPSGKRVRVDGDVAASAGGGGGGGGEVRPVLLVQVDQFGVAHAPFAQAR